MELCAFLYFNGNCRDAIAYYADVFGVEMPEIATYGDFPEDPVAASKPNISHYVAYAELDIKGNRLCFSDSFPETFIGTNIALTIMSNDPAEIGMLYEKLKPGCDIIMELQETAWSQGFAMLTDKFDITWQLNLCCMPVK
ncbi:hypothetical protein MsAg5_04420 [Methanosarcinaceae archaeon Ag5]|uniref:PhnB-like domain-containing protein n=1 Tax=Methanolapillus africanus TaxID=3028297 RepID=A0AAE4MIE9_9EURY|nr:hypothetical protein [Methanosarcinaceae archaeon Ag5]